MKKFLLTVLCAVTALGLSGCGGSKELTDDDIKSNMEKVSYELKCLNSDGITFCAFMNSSDKTAILYNDDLGFAYMNQDAIYDVKGNNIIDGDGNKSDLSKEYKDIIDKAEVSTEQVSKLLTKEFKNYIKKTEEETKKEESKVFKVGEKVTVSKGGVDYFSFVVNSVKVTADRNEYSDKTPSQVVIINYSYENINMDADLYISSMSFKVIDADGNIAETYPALTSIYPQSCPKGTKSDGEEAYGLKTSSSTIKLRLSEYLPGFDEVTRNFELVVEQ